MYLKYMNLAYCVGETIASSRTRIDAQFPHDGAFRAMIVRYVIP